MTRRQWLIKAVVTPAVAITGAVLGTMVVNVWLAAGRFSSQHWTDVADPQSLPQQALITRPAQRLALIRHEGRIAALSLVCTHLGCLVNTVDEGFFCPCHGSEFGPRGEVYSGPAPRNLDWLPLRLHQGRLWVQSGTRLSEPQWIAAPSPNDLPQG